MGTTRWVQLGLLLASLGVTLPALAKFGVRMIRYLVTHRRDEKIARFLRMQINTEPLLRDTLGQMPQSHRPCSSVQIATHLGLDAVKVFQALERLELQHRVEREGYRDSWLVTSQEVHDHT